MSEINDVLVYLWGDDSDATTVTSAAEFAASHEAHLTAALVHPGLPRALVEFFQPPVQTREAYEAFAQHATVRARSEFDQAVARFGVKSSFFSRTGKTVDLLISRARCADVVVIQNQRDAEMDYRKMMFNDFLLKSGSPFLVLPPQAEKSSMQTKNVLVAWDGSKQAALAVRTAIDVLRAAEDVKILNVSQAVEGQLGIEVDLAEHLSHHGINIEAKHAIGNDVANEIKRLSAESNADLIVMGGWGHTRIQEWILGGVTRQMLTTSNTPIWMMH